MFLLPNQQLERCDRVMQQRVKPHIHTTLAACTLRSFHNPGEPLEVWVNKLLPLIYVDKS